MITELNLSKVYNKCYYRIFEILSHNTRDNFWVILDRRVLNLSTLMRSIDEMPTNGKNQSVNTIFQIYPFYKSLIEMCIFFYTGIGAVDDVRRI